MQANFSFIYVRKSSHYSLSPFNADKQKNNIFDEHKLELEH